MKTIAISAFLGLASSIRVNFPATDTWTRKSEVYPPHLHWNEDPHSVPSVLSGKPYLTSTQARFIAENSTANIESREPTDPLGWHYNFGIYNEDSTEYARNELNREYVQLEAGQMTMTNAKTGATWRVIPDFGEKDSNIVMREDDIKNGEKFSGWTNPLSWTDDGADDNLVV